MVGCCLDCKGRNCLDIAADGCTQHNGGLGLKANGIGLDPLTDSNGQRSSFLVEVQQLALRFCNNGAVARGIALEELEDFLELGSLADEEDIVVVCKHLD